MAHPTKDARITLREVTKETLRDVLMLKVAPEQERFVATNAVSIAQAHFHPEVAWFRAIYADETPVGFLMLHDDPGKPEYHLWRFMIDKRFQKLGYGRRALDRLLDHVRERPGTTALTSHMSRARGARLRSTSGSASRTPARRTRTESCSCGSS
ncbi:MAG TPA: GNAT family N-acetyltransferase [Gemmatimonadota bacterium]|nr:GNAT family N-acetyltransferase [Gemmatimonadota bacterium]